jgi:hypothetical protein
MRASDRMRGYEDRELTVKDQERLEQVLLGPVVAHLLKPPSRVLPRKEYVVEMHQNTWLQPGQHIQ